MGGERREGDECTRGGAQHELVEHVLVSRALRSATVVCSILFFATTSPISLIHSLKHAIFRVFIQFLFFIAQTLKMESSKVM